MLTHNKEFSRENIEVVHSLDELLSLIKDVDQTTVWVIGGGQIYTLLFNYIDSIYVTKVDVEMKNADTWFPDLDRFYTYYVHSEGERKFDGQYRYSFARYAKIFV